MRTFPGHNYWGDELGSGLTVLQFLLPVLLAMILGYGAGIVILNRQQIESAHIRALRHKKEKDSRVTREEFQLYLDNTKRELLVIERDIHNLRFNSKNKKPRSKKNP